MRPHSARGFALVIVLWVLAGLTVVAVAIADSARASNEAVKALRERVRSEAVFLSAAARVEIIASTALAGRINLRSARGTLYVDGRATAVAEESGEWLSLQDTRGLVNLNEASGGRVLALLRYCGANEDEAVDLADTLADYIDTDQLKRAHGAEGFEYSAKGLAPPRNARLLSREEMWRVLGWEALRPRWDAKGCDANITLHNDFIRNRNTAPAAVLLADGLNETTVKALQEARDDGLPDTNTQTQGDDASNPFNFVGAGLTGQTLRIRQWADWVEWSLEYELELSPVRNGGPWRIHEMRSPPKPLAAPKAATTLPAVDFRVEDRSLIDALPSLPFGN